MEDRVDIVWVLLSAGLVALMQVGFCCLETGYVRAKNNINVAAKNLVDFCISGFLFWAGGIALMCGPSLAGLIGIGGFAPSGGLPTETQVFFFQLMFCSTAVTIVSGATAERLSYLGYILICIVFTLAVHPMISACYSGTSVRSTIVAMRNFQSDRE